MLKMSRDVMIEFIRSRPGVKITHTLFTPDEYIYSKPDGTIYTEEEYLFEDWTSLRANGIRMRRGGEWEEGWSLYDSK